MQDSVMLEVGKLQDAYQNMVDGVVPFTKKALCELCVPFRDKYGLTGSETLKIARRELTITEIINLMEGRANQ